MLEISFTEMVLFAWAVLATAAWWQSRDDAKVSHKMLMLFIENKQAREQMLAAHEKFMEARNG